jgi:hypothetical protein
MKHFASLKVDRITRILVSFTLLVSNVSAATAQTKGTTGYAEQAPGRQSPASSGLASGSDYQPLFQTTEEPTPAAAETPTATPTETPTVTPTPTSSGAAVTFFDERDYQGQSMFFSESEPDLSNEGLSDNVSSIQVSGAVRALLFDRPNYQGWVTSITSDTADLNVLGYNDGASSLLVLPVETGAISVTEDFTGSVLDPA